MRRKSLVVLVMMVRALVATSAMSAQSREDPSARPLSLNLAGVTLDEALRAVERAASVRLSYSSDLLPPSVRVTMARDRTTVADALHDMLRGTGLSMVVAGSGHIVILRETLPVSVDGPVRPAREAASTTTPQLMDRVLVMGTPAAGAPERQLTTAVSVVTSAAIGREQPAGMADVFRFGVPGVVAWDLGAGGPIAQIGSVRGSTSFSANYLKTYVDGVELASPYMLFAIDPDIVDRIEIIRGPQGSALYGSDAISGVAHLITKKGTMGAPAHGTASASGGLVETGFADHPPVIHRETAGVDGGGALASYHASAAFSESGSFVTNASAMTMSAAGAARAIVGPVLIEAAARTVKLRFSSPVPPELGRILGARAEPQFARARPSQVIDEHTLGVTLIHEPSQRWRQTLVAGYDRNLGALAPQRNPASVADALLGASAEDAQRASVRYSGSVRGDLLSGVTTSLTGGIEASYLERARSGPADVIGAPPGTPTTRNVALYIDTVTNAGAFGQVRFDVRDALFLDAGLRGERNSSFGSGYGTAWSPMAGASYVRPIDSYTIKLRAAYGRGIRPPPPSARRALATRDYRQIANPTLAPESQSGVEGGVEVYLSQRFSLSLTGFDQRAEGLIQHVVPDPRNAPRAVQQQNVGAISNRGVEVQFAGTAGVLRADVSLSTVDSRVERLSSSYTGDLRRGDRVPEVPSLSGATSVSARLGAARLTIGASYLGGWTGYDWLAYYAAIANGTPTPSLRSFATEYAGTFRPNVMISHDVTARARWFARVDNLTNKQRDGRDNLQVLAGRTTRVGVSFY